VGYDGKVPQDGDEYGESINDYRRDYKYLKAKNTKVPQALPGEASVTEASTIELSTTEPSTTEPPTLASEREAPYFQQPVPIIQLKFNTKKMKVLLKRLKPYEILKDKGMGRKKRPSFVPLCFLNKKKKKQQELDKLEEVTDSESEDYNLFDLFGSDGESSCDEDWGQYCP